MVIHKEGNNNFNKLNLYIQKGEEKKQQQQQEGKREALPQPQHYFLFISALYLK